MGKWDFTKKPIYVIIVILIMTSTFLITLYETFRIPPLKEEIDRLDKLLTQQEKINNLKITIKDLNEIITTKRDSINNMNNTSLFNQDQFPKKSLQKNLNTQKILTDIDDLNKKGDLILKTKLNNKTIIENYLKWIVDYELLIENLEIEYKSKYLKEFTENVYYENVSSKYHLIHEKVNNGKLILDKIKTIYENQ